MLRRLRRPLHQGERLLLVEGGQPAQADLCHYDNGIPYDAFDLYTALYGCVCGADGEPGMCGGKCTDYCAAAGATPSTECAQCASQALVGSCHTTYVACAST